MSPPGPLAKRLPFVAAPALWLSKQMGGSGGIAVGILPGLHSAGACLTRCRTGPKCPSSSLCVEGRRSELRGIFLPLWMVDCRGRGVSVGKPLQGLCGAVGPAFEKELRKLHSK